MTTPAPYNYVRDYYKNVVDKAKRFPNITEQWMSNLKYVTGEHVLNIGCGPTLFDYIPHFGECPKVCTGIDINQSTFYFLQRSMVPELRKARKAFQKGPTSVRMDCDDVTENIWPSNAKDGMYDSVLAVGFLAGHHGLGFDALMQRIRQRIRLDGTLVVISWHGPWRSAEESQQKKLYGYEANEETDPNTLNHDISKAGFYLDITKTIGCPHTYGWDNIQTCVFRKT
jgi:SAM-dependent methyltransferase